MHCVENPQIHFPALLGQDEEAHMVRKATCCWETSAFSLQREEQFSLIPHSPANLTQIKCKRQSLNVDK